MSGSTAKLHVNIRSCLVFHRVVNHFSSSSKSKVNMAEKGRVHYSYYVQYVLKIAESKTDI